MEFRCRECHYCFTPRAEDFSDDIIKCPRCADKLKPPKLMEVELSSAYKAGIQGQDLVVTKRWFNWLSVILSGIFNLIWVPGSILAFIGSISSGGGCVTPLTVLPFVLTSFFLVYHFFALLFNITETRVNNDSIVIRCYPLPCFRTRVIAADDIEQIYCEQKIDNDPESGRNIRYELKAVLNSGMKIFIDSFAELAEARAMEIFIEKRLGIKDREVDGECLC